MTYQEATDAREAGLEAARSTHYYRVQDALAEGGKFLSYNLSRINELYTAEAERVREQYTNTVREQGV